VEGLIHKIGRDRAIYEMSPANCRAIEVSPGDTIIVETEDCFGHAIVSELQTVGSGFDFSHINPATGPIGVRGALPGDTLIVNIESIEVDEKGVVETCPGWGPFGEIVSDCVTEMVPIRDGHASFRGTRFAIKPMIGVIGTSPAKESVSCGTPGFHGGNLDTNDICAGSKVFLPVFVEGANLALGDVHARMGNGEICGTGIEIRATVRISIELDRSTIDGPMVENDNAFYMVHSAKTFDEATRGAVERAVRFIADRKSISKSEAYMLISITCDLTVSQIVNPLVTVRVKIPKEIL
jgi:amidase